MFWCFGFILPFQLCNFKNWILGEGLYGKLKNDDSMIDYVYGPEPSKIWWRNLWTAPYGTKVWNISIGSW